MASDDLPKLVAALQKADAAGDTEAAQMIAAAIKQRKAAPQAKAEPQEPVDASPVSESALENFAAGAGKAVSDLGFGIKQRVDDFTKLITFGQAPEAALVKPGELEEKRRLEAPLMDTTSGRGGAIAGAIAASVPAAAIPGANTAAGSTLLGAGFGAFQPSASGRETVANTLMGGGLGRAGQEVGQAVSPVLSKAIAARKAAAAAKQQGSSVRDNLINEAREAGYVIPPSTTNPNLANTTLESISGKAATQQSASLRNQEVTNRMIRAELGLPETAPITKSALSGIRSKAGKVYEEVASSGVIKPDPQYLDDLGKIEKTIAEVAADFPDANVGANEEISKLVDSLLRDKFSAKGATEYVKQLRKSATGNLTGANAADPSKRALGFAQRDAAAALEDQIIRNLEQQGKGALAKSFNDARTQIAKTYSVEAALNEATGNIQARQLATQLRRGKPLSGGMEQAARFAQAFPKAADEVTTSPGVSALDFIVGAGGYTVNPALAALPLARPVARNTLLSNAYQNRMLTPSYNENVGLMRMLEATSGRGALAGPAGLMLAND